VLHYPDSPQSVTDILAMTRDRRLRLHVDGQLSWQRGALGQVFGGAHQAGDFGDDPEPDRILEREGERRVAVGAREASSSSRSRAAGSRAKKGMRTSSHGRRSLSLQRNPSANPFGDLYGAVERYAAERAGRPVPDPHGARGDVRIVRRLSGRWVLEPLGSYSRQDTEHKAEQIRNLKRRVPRS
jgi:hypothetical protein